MPINFDSRKRSKFALPVIEDVEEIEETQEATEISKRMTSPLSIDTEAMESISPRRPSSAKSSRKRMGPKSKQSFDSSEEPKPTNPPAKGGKSPRKISVLEVAVEVPAVKSVDVSTSVDLNLTRLSRIHRFIQTDMYSTEYGGLVNQVADLTTELEEKAKIISSLQQEIEVQISYFHFISSPRL